MHFAGTTRNSFNGKPKAAAYVRLCCAHTVAFGLPLNDFGHEIPSAASLRIGRVKEFALDDVPGTIVLPAAIRYQGELAGVAASLKAVTGEADRAALDAISGLVMGLQHAIAALEAEMDIEGFDTTLAEAEHCCRRILPAMLGVREIADALEGVVADDLWPLATYQEMLFIK